MSRIFMIYNYANETISLRYYKVVLTLILTKHKKNTWTCIKDKSSLLALFPTWICPGRLSFLLFPFFFFNYRLSGALVVDVQTYKAIFVGYVYTLTDGPSCRNVSPLLWDVLETPCQLLIQADWWQKETNRQRTLKLSLDDRTYWLAYG